MKSILLSIRPEFVCKILNGEKTIEIRRKFPKDYVGWVYIYCTKAYPELGRLSNNKFILDNEINADNFKRLDSGYIANGKVVGRFWCDKVDTLRIVNSTNLDRDFFDVETQLTNQQLIDYVGFDKPYYALHISKLEIFEKPKKLIAFVYYCKNEKCKYRTYNCRICYREPLTKAPQNYLFVETEE